MTSVSVDEPRTCPIHPGRSLRPWRDAKGYDRWRCHACRGRGRHASWPALPNATGSAYIPLSEAEYIARIERIRRETPRCATCGGPRRDR